MIASGPAARLPDRAPAAPAAAPGWSTGAVLPALLLAGGALGLAHVTPALAPLGLAGVALLGLALARTREAAVAATGLGLAATAHLWIAHPWQLHTSYIYGRGPTALAALMVVGFTVAHVVPKAAALWLGWRLAGRAPLVAWLPLAWLAGEGLRDAITHLSYNDWLNAQWQVAPALRAVGWLGWLPATWLGLAAAAATADALARRDARYLGVPLAVAATLAALPPRPTAPPGLLAGVGAVHMTGFFHRPREAPPGVRLMVWPEQASNVRPWVAEGPGRHKRLEPPCAGAASHLYGLLTRQPGGHQNAVVALAPDGTVQAARAKVRLFPFAERPVWGLRVLDARPLVPGSAAATLPTPLGPVAALICLEGLDRDYVAAEATPDVKLLTLASAETVLAGSRLAMRQFVGVAALLAAMTGRPVVRASLYGEAAIVDADGAVLAISEPGTDGVLTLAGDVVRHRAALAPGP